MAHRGFKEELTRRRSGWKGLQYEHAETMLFVCFCRSRDTESTSRNSMPRQKTPQKRWQTLAASRPSRQPRCAASATAGIQDVHTLASVDIFTTLCPSRRPTASIPYWFENQAFLGTGRIYHTYGSATKPSRSGNKLQRVARSSTEILGWHGFGSARFAEREGDGRRKSGWRMGQEVSQAPAPGVDPSAETAQAPI